MGKQPKDIDIATSLTADEICAILTDAKYIPAEQAYPVVIARNEGGEVIEIATFRKDIFNDPTGQTRRPDQMEPGTIIDDANRRDFTCNALYLNPITYELVDLVGGLEDIENHKLNFVGNANDRIAEDPLRILRAIRFKNRFEFEFGEGTKQALSKNAAIVENISGERLFGEITRILQNPNRVEGIKDLDDLGILQLIFPEVSAGKGIEQPREFHAEGDVWAHQLQVMESLPQISSEPLVWAALLHDIGKKDTQTFPDPDNPRDRIRFNGHEEKSADMINIIATRFRFSDNLKQRIKWLVGNHMRIRELAKGKMKRSKQLDMLSNPLFEDLVVLCEADEKASIMTDENSEQLPYNHENILKLNRMYQDYLEEIKEHGRLPQLKDLGIDGAWVANLLGISLDGKRGNPVLGKYMKALTELVRTGEINSQEQAKEWLHKQ